MVEGRRTQIWRRSGPPECGGATPDEEGVANWLIDGYPITSALEPGVEHPPVLALAHTGARLGEVLALTWADLDLKAGRISISKTSTPQGETHPPKGGRSRTVGASHRLLECLRRLDRSSKEQALREGRLRPDSVGLSVALRRERVSQRLRPTRCVIPLPDCC